MTDELKVAKPQDDPAKFVHMLLWDEFPECCGSPVIGASYMGLNETICCGNPEPALLNDKQIVASLRAQFPEHSASPVPLPVETPDAIAGEPICKHGARARLCSVCWKLPEERLT